MLRNDAWNWTSNPDSRYGLCGRKATLKKKTDLRVQEMHESGTPSLIVATVFVDEKKTDLRVQEMRVSGPPSLTVAMVSVDVKQH